jgi:hypothetical protein
VLDVRRGIVDEPLTVAEERPETGNAVARPKAAAQEAVLVQLLQPLRVICRSRDLI